jgi:hypothetical protein
LFTQGGLFDQARERVAGSRALKQHALPPL